MHAALQIIANANSIFSPRADCEWSGVHGVPLSARAAGASAIHRKVDISAHCGF